MKQFADEVRCGSNRVILAVGRLLPVFPRKRTSSGPVGMSQNCQKATLLDHLVSLAKGRAIMQAIKRTP